MLHRDTLLLELVLMSYHSRLRLFTLRVILQDSCRDRSCYPQRRSPVLIAGRDVCASYQFFPFLTNFECSQTLLLHDRKPVCPKWQSRRHTLSFRQTLSFDNIEHPLYGLFRISKLVAVQSRFRGKYGTVETGVLLDVGLFMLDVSKGFGAIESRLEYYAFNTKHGDFFLETFHDP